MLGLAVAAGLVNTAGRRRTTFLVERRTQVRASAGLQEAAHDTVVDTAR